MIRTNLYSYTRMIMLHLTRDQICGSWDQMSEGHFDLRKSGVVGCQS
jgi:hypothetical protein